MGDLLRQGSQWLEQQRLAHCSSPVTYVRGEARIEAQATFGRTEYEVEDDYGLRVAAHATDFLIAAADLAALGEPEPGDRVEADGAVHEVMALAGIGHWRWSDPFRTVMRIHAKEIGTE